MYQLESTLKAYPEHDEIDAERFDEGNGIATMAALVGEGKRVLDLGCASGYVAKLLARRGCEVVGVEINPLAAEEARGSCADVRIADLDQVRLTDLFGDVPRFDVIVCGDILEHLREPFRVLEEARRLLIDGGYIVASIPNVAHGAVRLSLLAGSFDYQDLGVLDATHLRFFTRKSIDELFLGAGFRIEQLLERTAAAGLPNVQSWSRASTRGTSTAASSPRCSPIPTAIRCSSCFRRFPSPMTSACVCCPRVLLAANTELAAARRRVAHRERELESARNRRIELERELEEARAHLNRSDEEMRRAQAGHAAAERELHASLEPRVRDSLAERVERLGAELEWLRPFVERAHQAEIACVRFEGREALLELRLAEMSASVERENAERENAARAAEPERRAIAAKLHALTAERDRLIAERAALSCELEVTRAQLAQAVEESRALRDQARASAESASADERGRLASVEHLLVDHLESAVADTQAESARLALLIDTVQSSRFWRGKRVLARLLRSRYSGLPRVVARPLPHILCSAAPPHPVEWSIDPKCAVAHEAAPTAIHGRAARTHPAFRVVATTFTSSCNPL